MCRHQCHPKMLWILTWRTVGPVSIVSSFFLSDDPGDSDFRATQWWPISAFQQSLIIDISGTPIPPLSCKHYISAHPTFFSRIGMPPPKLETAMNASKCFKVSKSEGLRCQVVDSSCTASRRHREATTWILRFEVKQFPGGGFKYFLFSPLFGEDSHFD